jgi:carboxymethylenebutenolidase
MADRLGAAGFVALAPDLYHGELAAHDEMDKAGQLMQSLPIDRAARDMSGAVDFLADHPATTGDGIGVMGFCMGGMLTFVLAAERPDKVKAAVPFYGFPPIEDGPADLSKIEASIQGHMAEHDDFFPPDQARRPRGPPEGAGQGRHHHRPRGHRPRLHGPAQRARHPGPEKVAEIWPKVTEFLHDKLG